MGKLIYSKPKGGEIVDSKSVFGQLINNGPSQAEINISLSNKLITRGVEALTPYGLLLVLTRPDSETFTTEYNP